MRAPTVLAILAVSTAALPLHVAAADPYGELGAEDSKTVPKAALERGPIIAYADDPSPPEEYTGTMLAIDALSIASVVMFGVLEGKDGEDSSAGIAFGTVGALGFAFGAPILHGTHGNGGRAVASVLLRQALPAVALLYKVSSNDGCYDEGGGLLCELDGAGTYMIGGMIAASIIDIAVLSRGDVLASRRTHARTWQPVVAPTPGGGTFGAMGRF